MENRLVVDAAEGERGGGGLDLAVIADVRSMSSAPWNSPGQGRLVTRHWVQVGCLASQPRLRRGNSSCVVVMMMMMMWEDTHELHQGPPLA